MRRLWLVSALVVVLLTSGCLGGGGPSAQSIVKQRAHAVHSATDFGPVLSYFSPLVLYRYEYNIDGNSVGSPLLTTFTHEEVLMAPSTRQVPVGPGFASVGDLIVTLSGSTAQSSQAFVFSGVPDGTKTYSGSGTFVLKWTDTSGEWRIYEIHVTLVATSD